MSAMTEEDSGYKRRTFLKGLSTAAVAPKDIELFSEDEINEDKPDEGIISTFETHHDFENKIARAAIYPDGFSQKPSEMAAEVASTFTKNQYPERLSAIPFAAISELEFSDPLNKVLNPKLNTNFEDLDTEELEYQRQRLENFEEYVEESTWEDIDDFDQALLPIEIQEKDERSHMKIEGLEKQPELDTVDMFGKSRYVGDSFDAYVGENTAHLIFHDNLGPEDVLAEDSYLNAVGNNGYEDLEGDSRVLHNIYRSASIHPEELKYN